MKDKIYVVGHKNPDTDSICSSLAYAHLKQKLNYNAIACRLGPLNEETKFALKYFGIENPLLIDDARTLLEDVDMDNPAMLSNKASAKDAWDLLLQTSNRSLLVVNEFNKMEGIVSASNLSTTRLMLPNDLKKLMASANLDAIASAVDGQIVCRPQNFKTNGKVHIVTLQSSGKYEEGFENSICILSDGLFKQKFLINSGAKLLIITLGQEINNDVYQMAKEHDVAIIKTDSDAMSVARYVNESFPVRLIMTKNPIYFKTSDNIIDVGLKMSKSRLRSYPVLDDEGNIFGQISRYHVQNYEKRKFILVDHSDKNQAINNIEDAEILEIIDHHNIGNIQTNRPIYYRNQKCGCTSSIIATLYQENGFLPEREYAGILLSAILSDTLNFQSKTTTKFDVITARWLAKIAEVNINDYANLLLQASVDLSNLSPSVVLNRDLKTYNFENFKIAIGQTNYHNIDDIQKIIKEFTENLKKEQKENNYDLLVMLFTQVMGRGSMFVYAGPLAYVMEDLIESHYDENSGFDPAIISRKQQLVPKMSEALKNI